MTLCPQAASSTPAVQCVPDSAFSPEADLTDDIDCSDAAIAINMYEEHNAVPDLTCLNEADNKLDCLK